MKMGNNFVNQATIIKLVCIAT